MNNKTRMIRLNKLIEVLQLQKEADNIGIPARLNGIFAFFHMGSWVKKDYCMGGGSIACYTSACALGSCALHPYFKKLGLNVKKGNKGNNENYPDITYKKFKDFVAGEELFGITRVESYFLFDPEMYRSFEHAADIRPQDVIVRVKKLIKKYSRKAA